MAKMTLFNLLGIKDTHTAESFTWAFCTGLILFVVIIILFSFFLEFWLVGLVALIIGFLVGRHIFEVKQKKLHYMK